MCNSYNDSLTVKEGGRVTLRHQRLRNFLRNASEKTFLAMRKIDIKNNENIGKK